jgi:hypothetical protein
MTTDSTDPRLAAPQGARQASQGAGRAARGEDSGPLPVAPDDRAGAPAAISDVLRLTLALNTANARLAFADGALVRRDLERVLLRAQTLVDARADAVEGIRLRGELDALRSVATQALAIAPAPSPIAMAAAKTGDFSALQREEQAWIAWRWAGSYSLRGPRCRARRRCETPPETPIALRRASPRDRSQRTRGES